MSLAANFAASNLWWPFTVLAIVGLGVAIYEGVLQRRRDKRAIGRRP
ncbi:hypothetical protein [Streptomyces chartreusis]|nr:hypothetical protein [Streptomyces chartreusis]GGW99094.1 hypothetical protein GCM10010321_11960 [Streptomyces chartreusis]